jgi:AAA family ATP:ADP antiporter
MAAGMRPLDSAAGRPYAPTMESSPETETETEAEVEVAPRVVARTVSVAAALFLTTAAFILAKTARDALYFMNDGLYDLPMAYLGIAMLSVPMSLLTFGLMKRLGTRRARVVLAIATTLLLLGIAPVVRPGGGRAMTTFFTLIPLLFGALFSSTWLLAADLLEHATVAQRARAYGWIGAASILGGVTGALVAKTLAIAVDTRLFFVGAAGALIAATLIVTCSHRYCPRGSLFRAGTMIMPSGADAKLLLNVHYARLLLAIAMLTSLAGLLIEFQFYLAAATAGSTMRNNAHFFATFYLWLNVAALSVQVFVIPQFQQRFGIIGCLLVLPFILLGGVTALLAIGSGFTQSFLRVAEGSLKSSIHRVSWEQAYLPLQRAQRAIAKVLVDGLGARLAEGTGAAIILFWLHAVVGNHGLVGRSAAWVGWLLFGVVVLWIALTSLLGRRLAEVDPSGELHIVNSRDIPIADVCIRTAVKSEGAA